MAEEAKTTPGTPAPNAQSGITLETVNTLIAEAVTKAVAPLQAQLTAAEANAKVIADTLAKAPPANKAEILAEIKADMAKESEAAKTAEADKAKATATADGERKAAVEKIKSGKLAELAKAKPDLVDRWLAGETDLAKLEAHADALLGSVNDLIKSKLPDVGGAPKDGGTIPGGQTVIPAPANLTPGEAKYAASIQLPK